MSDTQTTTKYSNYKFDILNKYFDIYKKPEGATFIGNPLKTVYFVGGSTGGSDEEIIYEIEYVDSIIGSIQFAEGHPLGSPLNSSTEWNSLNSDAIFVKRDVSIDLKSLSFCLLPLKDTTINIYSKLKENVTVNGTSICLTKPETGNNDENFVYGDENYGFRNFRAEGFTYNIAVEFKVFCEVINNSVKYYYKNGDNYYQFYKDNGDVEPFTQGSYLKKVTITNNSNLKQVYGYIFNDYTFLKLYKDTENNEEVFYNLENLQKVDDLANDLVIPQSIWITDVSSETNINSIVTDNFITVSPNHIERYEICKEFTPDKTFEDAFTSDIRNTGKIDGIENIYYVKFISKIFDIKYMFSGDYKNVYYEKSNDDNKSFFKNGGYFNEDYPIKYTYGKTLKIPLPVRNISVRGASIDESFRTSNFKWSDIKYNVYVFVGWYVSTNINDTTSKKLKRSLTPIDKDDIGGGSNNIYLTPYWYRLNDEDIQNYSVTQKPNRNVFAYAERISHKIASSGDNVPFVPFLRVDEDKTSNEYLLAGLQVSTEVLSEKKYVLDSNGDIDTEVSDSSNAYEFGNIISTVRFEDISNDTCNEEDLQNGIFRDLCIISAEKTLDDEGNTKLDTKIDDNLNFGLFSNLLRIDVIEKDSLPDKDIKPESLVNYNLITKHTNNNGGSDSYSYNFFTNYDPKNPTDWTFYYPLRIFNNIQYTTTSGLEGISVRVQTSDASDSVSSNLNIDKYPVNSLSDNWKVLLDTSKQITDISLVSLFDLLAYEADVETPSNVSRQKSYKTYLTKSSSSSSIEFQSEKNTQMGTKLSHDIILNNSSIYNESHNVYNSDVNSIAWKQNGIDIGIATPDKRNRPYTMLVGSAEDDDDIIVSGPNNGDGVFNFYKKSAYKKPDKVKDIYFPSVTTWGSWFLLEKRTCSITKMFLPADSNGQSVSSGWFSPYVDEMFSVQEYETDSQGKPSSTIDDTASVILSCQDTVLQNSLSFGGNLKCWTRMCLNPYNPLVVRFILSALLNIGNNIQVNNASELLPSLKSLNAPETGGGENTISSSVVVIDDNNAGNRNYLSSGSYNTTNFSQRIVSKIEGATDDNDPFIYALKHCFVWVRASFAADYVDPTDFDQKLNKDSSVTHKNLLIRNDTSNADFNRYHESLYGRYSQTSNENIDDLKFSGFTFPYIPKNAPLKDYVSDEYYRKKSQDETPLAYAYRVSTEEDSEIGSVLSESKSLRQNETTQNNIVSPIQFLDPDNVYEASDTNYPYSKRNPVIIPKSGNIWTDSRILSPTIDELWYMIKKVISGRDKDTDYKTFDDTSKKYLSQIYAKRDSLYYNDEDHRLSEVNNTFIFKDENNNIKEGDPVDYDFQPALTAQDETIYDFKIKEYFTQPDSVNYIIYNDIRDLSKIVQSNNKGISENVKIENVKIYKNNDLIDYTENTTTSEDTSIPYYTSISGNEEWEPRPTPMSLRELEGAILGNKFNIINNFRFVKENFAVTGKLGYTYNENNPDTYDESNPDQNKIDYAGSLYQFHKDYNFLIENPNTVYHKNGEHSTVSENDFGYDINTGVNKTIIEDGEDSLKYYNPEYNPNITNNDENNDESTVTVPEVFSGTKGRNKLPLLVENYGISDLIPENKNDYNGHDVYLNAMGEWKLENEVTRFPILRSKY